MSVSTLRYGDPEKSLVSDGERIQSASQRSLAYLQIFGCSRTCSVFLQCHKVYKSHHKYLKLYTDLKRSDHERTSDTKKSRLSQGMFLITAVMLLIAFTLNFIKARLLGNFGLGIDGQLNVMSCRKVQSCLKKQVLQYTA